MNGPMHNALMLVGAGNLHLAGRDVSGFWPDARTFIFMRMFEFRLRPSSGKDGDEFPLLAADPLQWFAKLEPWCRGLRLHHTVRARAANQKTDIADRMLAGLVGGGARWLIEAAGDKDSELWEPFHRVSDPKAADRKIWSCTHILQGTAPREEIDKDVAASNLAEAAQALRDALTDIEAYARAEKITNFADIFRSALDTLDVGKTDASGSLQEVVRYSGFDEKQLAIYAAASGAWVFGGMGSWNDVGGGERYDEVSERLYNALNDVTASLANSTYPG